MTTVKDFCKKFKACKDGYKWGLKYKTMERVFSEGDNSDYIVWAVTREGVLTDRELRLFACFCARQNWHLLTDRSKNAIEVAERYVDGLATDDDLAAARAAASAAAWDTASVAALDAACAAAWTAARTSASAAAWTTANAAAWNAARDAAWDTARDEAMASAQDAQIKWLRENTKPNFGAGLEDSK